MGRNKPGNDPDIHRDIISSRSGCVLCDNTTLLKWFTSVVIKHRSMPQ